ncbi:acetoin utilization protein AcuC [Thalassobacillus devorans]|uniref:Acetoin utilization protein AcuC n=2 Tax=Thalassobacillus devorans TaxID=279813 RepID=A0ABQ1PAB7_9BACI|nr:acetoin utilization protein AcuC [Thalassobacillus devorans]NIK29930.1 acetoin utilization protein AcuC [Thalassobacillus devorans]GGC93970.1 acetoin utilization protein AcuC [Thalassobacillus devorans]
MAEHARDVIMKCQSAFVYSDAFTQYKFRDDHPFNQLRVQMTKELLELENSLQPEHLLSPRSATEEELALVHSSTYIDAVKKASAGNLKEEEGMEFGIGTEDTPMFKGMHEASSLLVGSTLTAIDAVLEGDCEHSLNLGGGLHHGFERKASGFCIYNDGAVGIEYIRKKYGYKVLYVDTDAHHGDGVQWLFYDDPNVCTLSIHETGRYLFPGTGNVTERGLKEGYGYSFNLPIDAFTEDESFLELYESAFKEIVEYFNPDVIVTQNGADAHYFDPLTHLCSTMQIYERIPKLAHELAHKHCEGRWIALGGGGYDIWRVVPRAWAQIWKTMTTGKPFSGNLPAKWIEKWQKKSPVDLPSTWHDPEGFYKPIPRKAEITEKNKKVLANALQFIHNQKKYNHLSP